MLYFLRQRFLSRLTIAGSSCAALMALSQLSFAQDAELTLQEVLKYAETHAPILQTAHTRTRVASAGVAAESPWFPSNPELSASVGSMSQGGNAGIQYEFSVAQEIEIAGERGLRQAAARAEEKLGMMSHNTVRWELHVQVHRLYNELMLMGERREQAERFVAFSESLQNIAARQVQAGETAPLTLLVADADLAQTRSELLIAKQQESATRLALAGISGWPMSQPLQVRGSLPKIQAAPELSQLLELMAENHPSLQMRRQAVLARQAHLNTEQRVAWPNPTLGASFARQPELPGQPRQDAWLFSLTIPLPLWQRNQGGIAQAQAELDVAVDHQAEVTRQLETQLRVTASALNAAAARVDIYERSVIPKLEEKLSSLQRAYELGEVGLLQVSQTRERLLEGTRQYLDARVSYFRAAAELEGYVGIDLANQTQAYEESKK